METNIGKIYQQLCDGINEQLDNGELTDEEARECWNKLAEIETILYTVSEDTGIEIEQIIL